MGVPRSRGCHGPSGRCSKVESQLQCCACRVVEAERDPQGQEVKALGHCVLFYPKLHCESAKCFARENYGYDFEALKATVPQVGTACY